jgi:hypothetical protein
MTVSPACHVLPAVPARMANGFPDRGSNLARLEPDSLGHFLFLEPAQDCAAYIPNPHKAVVLPAAAWRARRDRRPFNKAKSRTFPFHQVNNISHFGFSGSLSRKQELMENDYAKTGKRLWQHGG